MLPQVRVRVVFRATERASLERVRAQTDSNRRGGLRSPRSQRTTASRARQWGDSSEGCLTMRLVLDGYGTWGRRLGREFRRLGLLDRVVDLDPDARRLAEELERVDVTPDLQAALAQDIDAVVVATPSRTHASITPPQLAAGKHVLSEKPLATSLVDSLRVRAAARRTGRIVQVGHLLEFAPAVVALRERAARGACGAVRSYEAEWLQTAQASPNNDPLWELVAHDIGLMLRTLSSTVVLAKALSVGAARVEASVSLNDGMRAHFVGEYGAAERRLSPPATVRRNLTNSARRHRSTSSLPSAPMTT